ncbi:hypothetical protein UB46_20785 [Burkholderiaceae bacterium 16]|nr:hypothetical protein UB46_20785 [Burkholderiaceae bacterium 16]
MAANRHSEYRGFEMTSAVEGGHVGGFYVVVQWMRRATPGPLTIVPIDGVAAGRFADLHDALEASFRRIKQAIDGYIDGQSVL